MRRRIFVMLEHSQPSIRKWLVVTLLVSSFAVTAVLVGQFGKGRKIQAELNQELSRLSSLGVELRQTTRFSDAEQKLSVIEKQIAEKGDEDLILAKIVAFAESPPFEVPPDSHGYLPQEVKEFLAALERVQNWISASAAKAALRGDRKGFDRRYEAAEALTACSQSYTFGNGVFLWKLPLEGALPSGSKGESWLREKWSAGEMPHFQRARLLGLGQIIAYPELYGRSFGSGSPIAGIAARFGEPSEIEGRVIALRQLRILAESVSKDSTKKALSRDLPGELQKSLTALPGGYIISNRYPWWPDFSLKEVYIGLIRMDVNQQRQAGKPLRLTWSKPYCVDPETGYPFTATVTSDRIMLRAKGWSRDTWF
jgi:hypothetical protein